MCLRHPLAREPLPARCAARCARDGKSACRGGPRAPQTTSEAKVALPPRDELKRQERAAIVNGLKQTNGKVLGPGAAAELLRMKPSTLASRISSLGINR